MTHLALAGKWGEARELHYRLFRFFKAIFVESNPIPIKAALAIMGQIQEEYRLPLCPLTASNRPALLAAMRHAGIAC